MAISHFYHDIYFYRFCSVYNLTLLLVTFGLWFVTSKLQRLQHTHQVKSVWQHGYPVYLFPPFFETNGNNDEQSLASDVDKKSENLDMRRTKLRAAKATVTLFILTTTSQINKRSS